LPWVGPTFNAPQRTTAWLVTASAPVTGRRGRKIPPPLGSDAANLDLLRACAVLFVLLFHTVGFFHHALGMRLQWLGRLGVLLFFVHTSLVLMLSLERQQARFGNDRLFSVFMTRRVFRLYPLSMLGVLTVGLFQLPVAGAPWEMHVSSTTKAGYVANFFLVQNVVGNSVSGSVLAPLWSLPYEIQMYLLLPALFLLVQRLPSWRWLMALWVFAVGIALLRIPVGHNVSFFSYVPCFLPGVIAYKLAATAPPRLPAFAWPFAVLGLVLVDAITAGHHTGWITCLVTGLAIPQFEQLRHTFLKAASRLVAKYSYGIYLSHYLCLWLGFVGLAFLPAPLKWLIFLTTLVGVPLVLYHGLEAPLIRVGNTVAETLVARRSAPASLRPPRAA
jgi:peptidoglycan/LPS O-acetylase OafA/YrhL